MAQKQIKVTKFDAARRQLDTAIRLWFADDDPVSIHTLACASHQIIHDLNRLNKGPDLLLDSNLIPKDKKRAWHKLLTQEASFFKHSDFRKNRSGSIELEPQKTEQIMLASIVGITYLGKEETDTESAFLHWLALHGPEILTPEGRKSLANDIPIDVIRKLRATNKTQFLDAFLNAE